MIKILNAQDTESAGKVVRIDGELFIVDDLGYLITWDGIEKEMDTIYAGDYLSKEDLRMGGKVEGGRQAKHQEILVGIFHLRMMVDRFQSLLNEIRGEMPPSSQKVAEPDGPESMPLASFMECAGARIKNEVDRLEDILGAIKGEIF